MSRRTIVAVSILVSLVLCEGALRIAWHNPYRSERPERILPLRIHHALTDHVLDRSAIEKNPPEIRFRTDTRSYIVPSRQHEDPQATILFLGGSTTECEAVDEAARFPSRVATLLTERGQRVSTLNAGHAGNTAHDSLNVLLNHAVRDRPDVAVFMHAANDVGLLAQIRSYSTRMARTMNAGDVLRWMGEVGSSWSHLLGIIRRVSTTSVVERRRRVTDRKRVTLEPAVIGEYEARLRAFIGMCRAFGIEPVLMTEPLASFRTELTPAWADAEAQSVFNDRIRTVGADEGALVIDLVRFLDGEKPGWDQSREIFYDGMHVKDAGSELYARYIAERLAAEVLPRVAEKRLRPGAH